MFGRCNSVLFAPEGLARQIDEVFDAVAAPTTHRAYPAINVWEDDKAVYVQAELPGYLMSDIDVTLERQTLTISGKREQPAADGTRWLHRERRVGEFARSVTLRETLDAERVSATMKDGLLLVTLPRSASALPRKIAVHPSQN